MRNRGQLTLAVLLILAGFLLLVGELFDVDMWAWCWPIGLILVGVWMLLRPPLFGSVGEGVRYRILGDIRRRGAWKVHDEELWIGVGDVDLDLREAHIPAGETRLELHGFVGDITLIVPQDVGVALEVTAFVASIKAFGAKRDAFLSPVRMNSEGYESAERRIRLESTIFVGDIKVRHA